MDSQMTTKPIKSQDVKRKKCYTVPRMRTLTAIMSIAVIVRFVLAARVTAPLPPPYADTESVTNVSFSVGGAKDPLVIRTR